MDPVTLNSILFDITAFVVGGCIGSFINVCVYRIPLNRSVVSPGSHCSACGAPIPWYNNLPIISWWVLRGRAACCGTKIDARYWIVEAGMALLFLAIWMKFGATDIVAAFIYAIFVSGLAAACLIDLDHYIIPRPLQPRRLCRRFHRLRDSSLADGPDHGAARLFLEPGQRHRGRADSTRRGLARHHALPEGGDGHGRREAARGHVLLLRHHVN